MNLAYVCIANRDQSTDQQIQKMKELDIEERFIFVDKQIGKDLERPQYQLMKRVLREGDLIYIDSLDILGRNYENILQEWKEITHSFNADIIILGHENIFDSRKFRSLGDVGKLLEEQFLNMLSYIAEQEHIKIRKRQMQGIDLAISQQKPYGRPKAKITDTLRAAYLEWQKGHITAVEAMAKSNVKSTTFYKLAKLLDEEYKGISLF